MSERWLPIPGWEDFYEVSDSGRVRGVDRVVVDRLGRPRRLRGRVLKPVPDAAGYLRVPVSREGVVRMRPIHQLVMEAFAGPCPAGLEVCHNDGDPADNVFTNLRYDTRSANQRDIVKHGRHRNASKIVCSRSHRLEVPNLVPSSLARGIRDCLACRRAHSARKTQRRTGRPVSDMKQLADQYYEKIMAAA